MYSLYFERSTGEKLLVKSQLEAPDDVFPLIKDFVHSKNPNFNIYYIRSWGADPIIYDVGSHTEFFYLYKEEIHDVKQ